MTRAGARRGSRGARDRARLARLPLPEAVRRRCGAPRLGLVPGRRRAPHRAASRRDPGTARGRLRRRRRLVGAAHHGLLRPFPASRQRVPGSPGAPVRPPPRRLGAATRSTRTPGSTGRVGRLRGHLEHYLLPQPRRSPEPHAALRGPHGPGAVPAWPALRTWAGAAQPAVALHSRLRAASWASWTAGAGWCSRSSRRTTCAASTSAYSCAAAGCRADHAATCARRASGSSSSSSCELLGRLQRQDLRPAVGDPAGVLVVRVHVCITAAELGQHFAQQVGEVRKFRRQLAVPPALPGTRTSAMLRPSGCCQWRTHAEALLADAGDAEQAVGQRIEVHQARPRAGRGDARRRAGSPRPPGSAPRRSRSVP